MSSTYLLTVREGVGSEKVESRVTRTEDAHLGTGGMGRGMRARMTLLLPSPPLSLLVALQKGRL
jgi:hypothetical protein